MAKSKMINSYEYAIFIQKGKDFGIDKNMISLLLKI